MTTKLEHSFIFDRCDMIDDVKNAWHNFLSGKTNNQNPLFSRIMQSFNLIKEEINTQRWITLNDDYFYDSKIHACWLGLNYEDSSFDNVNTGTSLPETQQHIISRYHNNQLDLPTHDELQKLLTGLDHSAPFPITNRRPKISHALLYKRKIKVQGYYCEQNYLVNRQDGHAVPLIRLYEENTFEAKNIREIFFLWIFNSLTPTLLAKDKNYQYLLNSFNYEYNPDSEYNPILVKISDKFSPSSEQIIETLLQEDKIRADIKPYHEKMLDDIEQGHWSLWDMEKKAQDPITLKLDKPLVSRDPKSSIIDGVVGIDFGTKSTVVAYQKETTHTQLMRVGIGDLSKEIEDYHYENPTIMEFNDLQRFMTDYHSRLGRPFTQWNDLTISHTAFQSLINSKSTDFNSFLSELKQWAGDKNRKLKLIDKQGFTTDLGSFLELSEESINPIELYAYYLGLYINNQHNGIYLNYILSFPVTYEVDIRNKIIDSFKQGIKKSLPLELHRQEDAMDQLSVTKGVSEPSAYAVIALQEYGFTPVDDEKVFYGIFDFGGGTTDFDFGIYKEATGKKQQRYDYVIEHFGAGGDRYLGGENLLELLSFTVFKHNKQQLLETSIQFVLPPECRTFAGAEMLLSHSREAKMNMKTLMEKLRPFWEGNEEALTSLDSGIIALNLVDTTGQIHANFELDIALEALQTLLEDRIRKGVVNFFDALRESFSNSAISLQDIDKINIFLAGNSSKSALVSKVFNEEIVHRSEAIKEALHFTDSQRIFALHPPLGGDTDAIDKPTGKTGVAFGLIETRKGGRTLVVDHNTNENNINFKYYLGVNKRNKFRTLIDRNDAYNKWTDFIDAGEDTFEVYYASLASASTNQFDISDPSIQKKTLRISTVDEDASVFIRLKNATEFEYVVATEDSIKNNQYLDDIKTVAL